MTSSGRRGLRGLGPVVCVVTSLLVARLGAHPVATTTVSLIVNKGGHYVGVLTTDADSLIAKLEALSNRPFSRPATSSATDRAARLDALNETLLAHVLVEFDGRAVRPAAAPVEVNDAGRATITITGLAPAHARTLVWSTALVFGSYPVALRTSEGHEVISWVQASDRSEPFLLDAADPARTAWRGVWLGFTHILPNGIDHILFVLGLFLLSASARQMVAQVSAFTLAHSITLGLSLYGVLSLPSGLVEPLIALSVAYVGVENLMTSKLQPWRIVVVFCFGLLHGLGFAEALASLHLSRQEMLATLVSFNVGVEFGQLTVIAMAALALGLAVAVRAGLRRPLAALASAAIGVTGVVWTIQRVL